MILHKVILSLLCIQLVGCFLTSSRLHHFRPKIRLFDENPESPGIDVDFRVGFLFPDVGGEYNLLYIVCLTCYQVRMEVWRIDCAKSLLAQKQYLTRPLLF